MSEVTPHPVAILCYFSRIRDAPTGRTTGKQTAPAGPQAQSKRAHFFEQKLHKPQVSWNRGTPHSSSIISKRTREHEDQASQMVGWETPTPPWWSHSDGRMREAHRVMMKRLMMKQLRWSGERSATLSRSGNSDGRMEQPHPAVIRQLRWSAERNPVMIRQLRWSDEWQKPHPVMITQLRNLALPWSVNFDEATQMVGWEKPHRAIVSNSDGRMRRTVSSPGNSDGRMRGAPLCHCQQLRWSDVKNPVMIRQLRWSDERSSAMLLSATYMVGWENSTLSWSGTQMVGWQKPTRLIRHLATRMVGWKAVAGRESTPHHDQATQTVNMQRDERNRHHATQMVLSDNPNPSWSLNAGCWMREATPRRHHATQMVLSDNPNPSWSLNAGCWMREAPPESHSLSWSGNSDGRMNDRNPTPSLSGLPWSVNFDVPMREPHPVASRQFRWSKGRNWASPWSGSLYGRVKEWSMREPHPSSDGLDERNPTPSSSGNLDGRPCHEQAVGLEKPHPFLMIRQVRWSTVGWEKPVMTRQVKWSDERNQTPSVIRQLGWSDEVALSWSGNSDGRVRETPSWSDNSDSRTNPRHDQTIRMVGWDNTHGRDQTIQIVGRNPVMIRQFGWSDETTRTAVIRQVR